MMRYLLTACVLCLTLFATPRGSAATVPEDRVRLRGPIRVVVVDVAHDCKVAAVRLRKLGFEVAFVPWKQVEPDTMKGVDVIFLPSHWGEDEPYYAHFEAIKDQFRRFVERGHGIVACQPNPTAKGFCTPQLLPYPITFQNIYDNDNERVNLAPDHFITGGLAGKDMPFPADPMIKVDPRWTVLAKQKKTGWASLAVAAYGDGRVVVQTAHESPASSAPLGDEILRRMVEWAARRERR